VRASNVEAQALYRRFGFAPVGVRKAYYTHPVEDALVMLRDRP
jgi:[ribosomal protein S18]-alanine N-acetyltransferase